MSKLEGEFTKQDTVHGNIINFKGFSFERIIIYICLTAITLTWLLIK